MTFTTCVISASFILYGGFNTSDAVNIISLLSGFLVIFTGVYLLNLSRGDPNGQKMISGTTHDGIATDIISGIQTRRSMQARRSGDPHRMSMGSNGYARAADRQGLIHAYDEEEGLGLEDLATDSDEDSHNLVPHANGKLNGHANGSSARMSFSEPKESRKSSTR